MSATDELSDMFIASEDLGPIFLRGSREQVTFYPDSGEMPDIRIERGGIAVDAVVVDPVEVWAKIEAYVAAKHEHGRSMCCESMWETEAIEQTLPPLANSVRAALGLDSLP